MVTIITELSKYAMILSLAIYTVLGFRLVRRDDAGKKAALWQQNVLMFGMQFLGNLTLYLSTENEKILLFYIAQLGAFILFLVLQRVIYPNADQLLNHNMLLLLSVGLLMLARLSFDKAERQAELAALAAVLTFVIPVIIRKSGRLRNLYWLYGAAGFGLLAVVFIAGSITHGAKLSITVYGITLQPSELVKVLFVFFVAGMLHEAVDFKRIVLTSALAAAHVLLLVVSKDLGAALIFFVTYLVMLYVASRQPLYFFGGLLAGSAAAWVAWKLFAHVQTRVLAWSDPFSVIAEEMGILFALLLIFIYLSSFYMILNIAIVLKDSYYKLVAVGLGTLMIFQVFLSIGGVTKFIPSTGVTLPFVSYGGSSLLGSFLIWSVIQGMYLKRSDEVTKVEREADEEKAKKEKKSKQSK